jgi:hypothetical protein
MQLCRAAGVYVQASRPILGFEISCFILFHDDPSSLQSNPKAPHHPGSTGTVRRCRGTPESLLRRAMLLPVSVPLLRILARTVETLQEHRHNPTPQPLHRPCDSAHLGGRRVTHSGARRRPHHQVHSVGSQTIQMSTSNKTQAGVVLLEQ